MHLSPFEEIGFSMRVRKHTSQIDEVGLATPFLREDVLSAILENTGEFVDQVLVPLCCPAVGDSSSEFKRRKQAYKAIFDEGLSGISLSQEYGGLGLPVILRAALQEIMCSADSDLWRYIDNSMLAGGLISELGSDQLKSLVMPKVRTGEWAIAFDLDVLADSPPASCRLRALQHEDGSFKIFGDTAGASSLSQGLGVHELRLVKAMIQTEVDTPQQQALFLVRECVAGEATYTDACGWMVTSIRNARTALAHLQHASVLCSAISVTATAEGKLQFCRSRLGLSLPANQQLVEESIDGQSTHRSLHVALALHQSRIEAWRGVSLAHACTIDLEQGHRNEKVRRHSKKLMGIISIVLDAWVKSIGLELTSTIERLESGSELHITSNTGARLHTCQSESIVLQQIADSLIEKGLVPDGGATFRFWLNSVYQTFCRLKAMPFEGSDEIGQRIRFGSESLQVDVEWILANYGLRPQMDLPRSVGLLSHFATVLVCSEMANDALHAAELMMSGCGNNQNLMEKIQSVKRFVVHELTLPK